MVERQAVVAVTSPATITCLRKPVVATVWTLQFCCLVGSAPVCSTSPSLCAERDVIHSAVALGFCQETRQAQDGQRVAGKIDQTQNGNESKT